MTSKFLLKISNHGKKWPVYRWMGAGSIIIAGFVLATYAGLISWVPSILMTSVIGIGVATMSAISLRPRSEATLANLDSATAPIADTQVSLIVEKPMLIGVNIVEMPPMVVKTENSMPKMDSVEDPVSMGNSINGVYISSFEAVRQQLSNQEMTKEIRSFDNKENHDLTKKEKVRNAKKKEKAKPHVRIMKRKIAHRVLSAVRA